MSGFFRGLKKKVFGDKEGRDSVPAETEAPPIASRVVERRGSESVRNPFFVQIGLDFGTSFCKVVCRDLVIDKAWVYSPSRTGNGEIPFLIPSAVSFDTQTFSPCLNRDGAYQKNYIPHLKMALEKVAKSEWNDTSLQPVKARLGSNGETEVRPFVELAVIYLLAGLLGDVRASIRKRFPGSVEGDQIRVNMAVPVASADDPDVEAVFDRCLRRAWVLADDLAGHPALPIQRLTELVGTHSEQAEGPVAREECYLYPEVSANVQGFIWSRSSQPGIYLFSDTGAGTVDQSLFIFKRDANGEVLLTYLFAQVLPLGSSLIERIASELDGEAEWDVLDAWRRRKESGEESEELNAARDAIEGELSSRSGQTIHSAKMKLISRDQINDLRVIFGGGGHTQRPYAQGVLAQFDSTTFRDELIQRRRRERDVFELGMSEPQDLEFPREKKHWMTRLSVAYGLAFDREQLAPYKLPAELPQPDPTRVFRRERRIILAPTNDDC